MRDGPWKLVVGERDAKKPALFQLEDDLGEKNDLATTQSQRVDSMLTDLEAWQADVLNGATRQPERLQTQ